MCTKINKKLHYKQTEFMAKSVVSKEHLQNEHHKTIKIKFQISFTKGNRGEKNIVSVNPEIRPFFLI